MACAKAVAAEGLEKFDESKVERDEQGRFSAKGAFDGATAGLTASLLAHDAINFVRARKAGVAVPPPETVASVTMSAGENSLLPRVGLRIDPQARRKLLRELGRHALPIAAAGALGGLARGPVGNTVRTAGEVATGYSVGSLAGFAAQLALAAATRGRARGRALPTIGGAIGGGLVLAQALDLTARQRKAADSGT